MGGGGWAGGPGGGGGQGHRAEGCPWDDWACAKAARGGHLEVLKWLRAKGWTIARVDVRRGGTLLAPGGAQVAAGKCVPVGRKRVVPGGEWRAPRRTKVAT